MKNKFTTRFFGCGSEYPKNDGIDRGQILCRWCGNVLMSDAMMCGKCKRRTGAGVGQKEMRVYDSLDHMNASLAVRFAYLQTMGA